MKIRETLRVNWENVTLGHLNDLHFSRQSAPVMTVLIILVILLKKKRERESEEEKMDGKWRKKFQCQVFKVINKPFIRKDDLGMDGIKDKSV